MRDRMRNWTEQLMGRDRIVPVSVGAILVATAIFMLYAFVLYLTHGHIDQSIILNSDPTSVAEQSSQLTGRYGVAGHGLMHQLVNEWVGLGIVFIIFMVGYVGIGLLGIRRAHYLKAILFCSIATFWASLFATAALRPLAGGLFFYPGGVLGEQMYRWLYFRIDLFGIWLVLLLTLALMLFLFFKSIRLNFNEWAYNRKTRAPREKRKHKSWFKKKSKSGEGELEAVPEASEDTPSNPIAKPILIPADEEREGEIGISVSDHRSMEDEVSEAEARARQLVDEQGEYDPRKELSRFEMPSAELLKKYDQQNDEIDLEEIEENKRLITSTLNSFKIEIESIHATVGPAITLYEVVPAPGIHIKRIRSLEDNISMDLSSLGIRIIAPMPGKGTIGMEVPNKKPQIVSMRSVILSKRFQESKAALPVALGRTITNEVFVFDLAKVPHLLVAGATGQGKSVGLNAIIASLLYKLHPAELKFVMVDPKMVEFSLYAMLEKHYMAKLPNEEQVIITDPKRVAGTLESLCEEMDQRYVLLSEAHVRNIKEYNEKFKERRLNPERGHRFLPYIVLIIDEYGDLMLTGGREIENPITRLAQKARAVGIHAIIATQRPMATIITGAIKANFPGRLAFRVSSGTDSRIILDTPGANRLIGRGDSLFSQGNDLTRVQCAFIDTPEVSALVNFIGEQRGFAEAYPLPEVKPEGDTGAFLSTGELNPDDRDELFEAAARRIVADQRPSASYIQMIFGVGYNRASRLMVQLEHAGIIAPQEGNKARELLVTTEEQLERILHPDD